MQAHIRTMNIGITGHQKLEDSSLWGWADTEIDELFSKNTQSLIGISSLAIGADQLFANSVLRNSGSLWVIIPFNGYELKFSEGTHREEYFRLLNRASQVEVLEWIESDELSYFNAGKRLVDLSDILFAVWNNKPAAGLGGTGDVVKYAIDSNKKVFHLNPITQTVNEK